MITGVATLISVPIGLMAAIYLTEYGDGRLRRALTFFVDVMTGIPSIVAGLFAYALFALFFGPGIRLGVMGSVALSVLMIPIVIRASEEVLKIVPNHLREAAYALGTPKWKTIAKVVLPTAFAGLVTGVMIAIARIIGETAPLLVTTGVVDSINTNPFEGRMQNLAVYAYSEYRTPGVFKQASYDRAWAAALTADRYRDGPQPGRAPDLPPLPNRDPLSGEKEDHDRCRSRQDAAKPEAETARAQTVDPRRSRAPAPTGPRAVAADRQAKTIEARDVNLFYGDFHAVEDVTMKIEPNKVTALIGSSGCGKTTFLRSLNRMHELTTGAQRSRARSRSTARTSTARASTRSQVRRLVGMVFQQPNPFPTMSIYDNVAAGLNLNVGRVEEGREGRGRRALACAAPTSGTRSRTASTSPARASPAASSSGSASPARSRSSPRCC